MKPEELLMQYYRYWTIPDLGLSEDEKGYVDALRIGAEAISERDALKDETQQVRRFLRGCMNHAFDETPLVQVARDVSGEFHRNRYQIQQRNTQINEMREERDAMKAEVERLRAEKEQGISDAMECFATMGCPKHTGENTPPFDEFNKLLHGRCHICDVQRIAELEADAKRDPMDDLNQTLQEEV